MKKTTPGAGYTFPVPPPIRQAFTLKSVPPGEYKAYAWEDIDPGAYMDPDFVKPFNSAAESVSVPESGHLALQLTLIPAAAAPVPQ